MRILKRTLPLLIFTFFVKSISAQALYDINTIQQINIHFSQSNWDYQMDTAKAGDEGYILADWVEINGVLYDSVGVKYKGNSSYNASYAKNPLHISLDEFRNQSYLGYTDLKLGNGYSDPSMIREALAYNVLQNYMDCPQSNFADVYINENYQGLFSNDESISKKFCSDHFYSSKNTFVKCNPKVTSAAYRSNLKFINSDSSSYMIRYDMQSNTGWNELVALCDSLSNNPSSFSSIVDVDRVIWMLAFNNVLVNLDSYSGAFAQNHYTYKDNTGHYNPVVWDLNMAFGGFPFAGSQGVGMGTLDTAGMRTLSPLLHSTESDWPLIVNVIGNPVFKKMYIAHMRTITDEMFAGNYYKTTASTMQSLINNSVQNDVNSFFSYTQFQNGLTDAVNVNSHLVPGIITLMDERVAYLKSTTEFSFVPPVITNVVASDTFPAYLGPVTITTTVANANANSVWLGYRYDKAEKFVKVLMFDDGLHDDGIAGDNIYGAGINMLAARVQYYIYAENNDAGVFSPARAEHEFYNLYADIQTAGAGEVVINEFLAVNQNDTVDENGAHEDWIELYNSTPNPLNLFGLYLSDTYANLTKFSFPENSVIQPNSYFMIWADEDNTTTGELHCNFKLSSNGEAIFLSTSSGNMIDSIVFGPQVADYSMGRCPNGIGPFLELFSPSFKLANHCTDGIDENGLRSQNIEVYPNPAGNSLTLAAVSSQKIEFIITDLLGEIILSGSFSSGQNINTTDWSNGLYIFSCGNFRKKILIAH